MTRDDVNRQLSATLSKAGALQRTLAEQATRLPEIRAKYGNPFFYSRPKHPDQGEANYTGQRSHSVMLSSTLELKRVREEIRRLEAELARLGA